MHIQFFFIQLVTQVVERVYSRNTFLRCGPRCSWIRPAAHGSRYSSRFHYWIWLRHLLTSGQSQQFPAYGNRARLSTIKGPQRSSRGLNMYLWCYWCKFDRRDLPPFGPSAQAAQDPSKRPAHLLVPQSVDDGVDH